MRTCQILAISGLICGVFTTPAMAAEPVEAPSVEVYMETLNSLRDYSRSWIAPVMPEAAAGNPAQDIVLPRKKPRPPATAKHASLISGDLPVPSRKPFYKGPPLRQSVASAEAVRPYKPVYSQAKSVPVDDVNAEALAPPPYAPPQFEVPGMLASWFSGLPALAAQQLAPEPGSPNDPSAIEPAAGVATYTLSLRFEPEQLTLSEPQAKVLGSENFTSIVQNPHQRIQIYSYASSKTGNESESRRISLARALEVRALLTQRDIDAKRIDIIAKGQQNQVVEDQPAHLSSPDRIEIISAAPGEAL